MKYLTGYVWQSPRNAGTMSQMHRDTSILLQQLCYGRRNIVLAAACKGEVAGGYVTAGLKLWLAERVGELFAKKADAHLLKKELEREVRRLLKEVCKNDNMRANGLPPGMECSVVLMADQDCWLLQNAGGCMFLINRRLYGTCCRKIECVGGGPVSVIEGLVERGVGVLLGSRGFLEGISGKIISQCLAPQQIFREEQIRNRLRELTEESRRQKYFGECSAIYIKSI